MLVLVRSAAVLRGVRTHRAVARLVTLLAMSGGGGSGAMDWWWMMGWGMDMSMDNCQSEYTETNKKTLINISRLLQSKGCGRRCKSWF